MRMLRGALLRAVSSKVVAVRALACKGSAVRALSGKGSAAWNEEWRRLGLGAVQEASAPALNRLMFVQTGFGCDQHGDRKGAGATSAAVRACRNAIEFNSIPSIRALVPNGYEGMKLAVDIAVPEAYHGAVDEDAVRAVFPYGAVSIQLQPGGAEFSSGIAIPAMGDKGDALVVALCCVTVGY